MEIAFVGLGRMGSNMARRLLRGGHRVVVGNRSPGPVEELAQEGAIAAFSWAEVVAQLQRPRSVWIMVPAGEPTESLVSQFADLLAPDDLLVDGGNSHYKDTLRRAEHLAARDLRFVDVGTSGGIWGRTEGYSMMVGGDPESVARIQPALETLAPQPNKGWGRVGPVGAGHFVKMVHNGIEYGLMQAYAEGFEILRANDDFSLDLGQIASIWRHGSVIRSWLLDLAAAALQTDPGLTTVKDWVADSGEGRWAVFEAIDQDVPAPAITLSLLMRLRSRQEESYAAKLVAALRGRFGGHAVLQRTD